MSEEASTHERHMRRCLELAGRALETNDAPVGAVVVLNDRIIGEGIERVKGRRDVTAHAEIEALRAACAALGSTDLAGATLYTSVEPCVMCAYAVRLARISVLVTGAPSSDAGRALNGRTVVSTQEALPDRPVPAIVRGVLLRDCQAVVAAR